MSDHGMYGSMYDDLNKQKGYAERMRGSDERNYKMSSEEKARRRKLWNRVINRSTVAMEGLHHPSNTSSAKVDKQGHSRPTVGEQIQTGYGAFKRLFHLGE